MPQKNLLQRIKPVLLVVWIIIIISAIALHISSGNTLSDYKTIIPAFIDDFGIWGPILYIVLYAIRPIIFFPATILTTISGALFGVTGGIIYTVIGENLSANFAFLISRYFGRNLVEQKESKYNFLKKIDHKLADKGILTIMLLRLAGLPFDLTNYAAGLTSVKQRDYAIGTFIGIIPGLVAFVLFGNSFKDPKNIIIAAALYIGSMIVGAIIIKRDKNLANIKKNTSK